MAMLNNTEHHVSDLAKYIEFDPTGSNFDPTVKDVQKALSLIHSTAIGGIPVASETAPGIIQIATSTEVEAGIDGKKAVTPATLKGYLLRPRATETQVGVTKLATEQEALGFSDATVAISPAKMKTIFDRVTSNETRLGTIKTSSQTQATGGTDNTTAMTPLRVKQAILANTSPIASASETTQGTVRLATKEQTVQGASRDLAVTPYGFANANATESKFGTIKIANDQEVRNLSLRTVAVTPGALAGLQGTADQKGLVKLSNWGGDTSTALRADAPVVPNWIKVQGKELKNDIWLTANDLDTFTKGEIENNWLRTSNERFPAYSVANGDAGTRMWMRKWSGPQPYNSVVIDVSVLFNPIDGSGMKTYSAQVWKANADGNGLVQHLGDITVDMYQQKSGSKGHYWGYQTSRTLSFMWGNVQFWQEDGIVLIPINSRNVAFVNCKASWGG